MAPRIVQKDDILGAFVKRTIRILLPYVGTFTRNTEDSGEEKGIFLALPIRAPREKLMRPATSRAFFTYWANFTTEYPVDTCEEFAIDLRKLDAEFGQPLHSDTVFPRDEMLGRRDNDGYFPALPRDSSGAWQGRGSQQEGEAPDLLLRAHNATSGPNVRTYKLRAIPNNVLPGLEVEKSTNDKRAKLQNFHEAVELIAKNNRLQLFASTTSPNEYNRLLANARALIHLLGDSVSFGTQREWRDICAIRYNNAQVPPTERFDPPLPQDWREPMAVRGIINAEEMSRYRPTVLNKTPD